MKTRRRLIIPVVLVVSLAITAGLVFLVSYWWVTWGDAALVVFVAGLFIASFIAPKFLPPFTRVPFQAWLGAGAAMMLVLFLPVTTLLVLCGCMAAWDMYAVFRGPLRVIASEAKGPGSAEKGTGSEEKGRRVNNAIRGLLMADLGVSALGLGDVVFFSMVLMLAAYFGELAALSVFACVTTGVLVTFFLLRSRRSLALPGLPIPMLLSLAVLGILYLR